MKKLLALASSPRKNGNTNLLLDKLLQAIRQSTDQIQIEHDNLNQFQIQPCLQCDACHKKGLCVINDDMKNFYPKIQQADWLIFASPIYFMAHNAQAKLFIDRCQPFWAQHYILKQKIRPTHLGQRRAVFIAAGATHGQKVFEGAKTTMKWLLDSLQMQYFENLLIEGLDQAGAVTKHPTALKDAFKLGQKIAQITLNPFP